MLQQQQGLSLLRMGLYLNKVQRILFLHKEKLVHYFQIY
nr:MAG TPA: hypothetical protein [Caudoviricetes sp.]